jgi:hypothetical protein
MTYVLYSPTFERIVGRATDMKVRKGLGKGIEPCSEKEESTEGRYITTSRFANASQKALPPDTRKSNRFGWENPVCLRAIVNGTKSIPIQTGRCQNAAVTT